MANSELVERSDEMVTAPWEAVSVAGRLALGSHRDVAKAEGCGTDPELSLRIRFAGPRSVDDKFMVTGITHDIKNAVGLPVRARSETNGHLEALAGPDLHGQRELPMENGVPLFHMPVMLSSLCPVLLSWIE